MSDDELQKELDAMNADMQWQSKYQVGMIYKTMLVCCVDREKYKIQVIMPDGSTDWIDRGDELRANQTAAKENGE